MNKPKGVKQIKPSRLEPDRLLDETLTEILVAFLSNKAKHPDKPLILETVKLIIAKTASIKDAEHQQKIAEIFEEIEKSTVLSASIRDDVLEQRHSDWQTIKSRFLKEGLGGK